MTAPYLEVRRVVLHGERFFAVFRDRHKQVSRLFTEERLALAELGRQRARAGRPQRRSRACLTCGTAFPSEGVHNRMCPRCRGGHQPVAV